MPDSIAHQSVAALGGGGSLLVIKKSDHREIEQLLQDVDAALGPQRLEQLSKLGRLFVQRAFADEVVLWPALRRIDSDCRVLTREAEHGQDCVREAFAALKRTDMNGSEHRQWWLRVASLLREDVRVEEDRLLPRLQEVAVGGQLARMGRAWDLVRRIAPTRPHLLVRRYSRGAAAVATMPLIPVDRTLDAWDRSTRQTSGTAAATARGLSAIVGRLGGPFRKPD